MEREILEDRQKMNQIRAKFERNVRLLLRILYGLEAIYRETKSKKAQEEYFKTEKQIQNLTMKTNAQLQKYYEKVMRSLDVLKVKKLHATL